jgi:HEAT repeat protein
VKYLAAKLKPAKEEGADPRIRRALIEVLDKIGSDEDPEDIPSTAMPEFLDALTDEDSNVRKTAAVFLGKSGDPSVAPSLIDTLLKDESSSVRGEAVKALDKLDPGWRESENLTSAAPKFVASLNDEFFGKRRRAAEYLGIIRNKAATPHLVLALKDDDDDVREAAQNALSLIDIDWKQSEAARAAIPQFAAALKDSRGGVRANAAKLLGEIADPAGVEPLIKALSDDDVKVRHQAADALKKIGDPSSEQPLAEYYEAERAQREKNRQELAELQVALLPTGSMRPFALAAVKEALENLPKLEKTKWIKANSGKFGPVSPYSWPGTDRTFNSAEACIEELNKDSEEGKKVLWAPTTNSLIVEIHAESQHYSSYNTETLIERKIILRQADGSFYRFYTFIV